MRKQIASNFYDSNIYWIIIAVIIGIGTIIRFKGLGTWPLALDEYYIIKSSEFIIEHGVPQFPNGGYYSRGILMQYLISGLLYLGIKAEFAGRLLTVLANLITIPAIYLIAKKIGNKLIATLVIVIFCLSIWEIEFARFARMYTPFQAIFVWYVYFALIDYFNSDFKMYKYMLILSGVSIFVYEGSVFLAAFNFVPFVIQRKIKFKYLALAFTLLLGSVFANVFDFRTLLSNPIFPPELNETIRQAIKKPPIVLPKILLPFAFEGLLSTLLTVLLIISNLIFFAKLLKFLKRKEFWSIFSLTFLVTAALLNQFGLFILVFILFNAWNLIDFNISKRRTVIYFSILFFFNLLFWFGFGLLKTNWYSLFNDFSSFSNWGISKRLLIGFFNFPENYYTLVNYFNTLPVLTVFSSLVFTIFIIYFFLKSKLVGHIGFITGTVIFFSIIATIPSLLYDETRYTFFLVPILIIIVNYSFYSILIITIQNRELIISTLYIIIVLTIFVCSNDFNLYHLANIDSKEVNYRLLYDNTMKKHLYRRWDIKTPIDYVNGNMNEGDLVIINENSQEYYLSKVDYFSFDYRHHAFGVLSVEEGKKERWSDAKLIYDNKSLINFIENREQSIWFLVFPEFYIEEIDFYKRFDEYLVFTGIDNLVKVYKFP